MTTHPLDAVLRDNIQRRCAKKWPGCQDPAVTLAVAVSRVTGKSRGLYSLGSICRAYERGYCSLLLLRGIARALDCTIDDLTTVEA
jgi:hypothetical protein